MNRITVTVLSIAVGLMAAGAAQAQNSSVSSDKDSAGYVDTHHYNSPAERAHDALLITEVKSAIAQAGISDGYPVEVDADHGTVTLSGVVHRPPM